MLQNKAEKDPGSVTSLTHVSWVCKHNNVSCSTGGIGKAAELGPRSRLCPGSTRGPRRHLGAGGRGEELSLPATGPLQGSLPQTPRCSEASASLCSAQPSASGPRGPCTSIPPLGHDPPVPGPQWLSAAVAHVPPHGQTDRQRVTDAKRASISHGTCCLLPAHEPNPCHGYNHSPGAFLQARTAMSPSRGDQLPTQRKPREPRRRRGVPLCGTGRDTVSPPRSGESHTEPPPPPRAKLRVETHEPG